MEKLFTLLYTHNIRGDLDLLPRLYTFIKYLKSLPVDEDETVRVCAFEPVQQRTILLDLGHACVPEAWHCEATEGRSALLVMDAMGYDVVNVEGYLSSEARTKLPDLTHVALLDRQHPIWTSPDQVTVVHSGAHQFDAAPRILITLETTPQAPASLPALAAGQVGVIHFGTGHNTKPHVFDLPADTLPDPTIAATVDFVVSEARQYQKKRGGSSEF